MSAKTTELEPKEEKKTFFKDIEQDEDVVRGHIKVIQLITYAVVGKKKNEFDEWVDQREGRGMYFCQTEEDKEYFVRKHPDLIIESFTIQLKQQAAMDYLNDLHNMDAFGVK